jgi:hypothetical protein
MIFQLSLITLQNLSSRVTSMKAIQAPVINIQRRKSNLKVHVI